MTIIQWDAKQQTLIHTKPQKENEKEERYHDCKYPKEAAPPILVELFIREFDESESHVFPLLREHTGLDVKSTDEPSDEVEKNIAKQNEKD